MISRECLEYLYSHFDSSPTEDTDDVLDNALHEGTDLKSNRIECVVLCHVASHCMTLVSMEVWKKKTTHPLTMLMMKQTPYR